jgi:hypothetical protein
LLLGYKPVQHVTVLNTVGNCNTVAVAYPGIFFGGGGGGSTNSVEDREQREQGSGGGSPLVRGSAQFAIRFDFVIHSGCPGLLRMYFPRNWEFGSALSKLQNFGGGGVEPPKPPFGTPLYSGIIISHYIIILWDHRRICSPSLTETSLCGAYLYTIYKCDRAPRITQHGVQRFNLLKPSSFLYTPPGLTYKNSTWCSLCVECFVRISEQRAAFAL